MDPDLDDDPNLLPRRPSGTGRLVMVLGILLPASIGAGIAIGAYTFGSPHPSAAPVASVEKPKCPPVPTVPVPVTLVDRAIAGDYQALDALKAKAPADRTVEETLALWRGKAHNKSAALEGFNKEIKKNADVLSDKSQLSRLKDFLNDRETTNQAAAVIVDLPGTLGPDLLYEAATARKPGETGELADELLETKQVRDKASPALLLALDLKKSTQCEDFKALLPRAAEQGDRRSVPLLFKLTKKHGCGDNKLGDCYECLRPLEKDKTAIDLGKALKAALKRPAPKL